MACLRWNPVTATNSSRMRPFSARRPLLVPSMTAATSSSRVAMLTRLIAISPTPSRPGAFQMRQQLNIREHFWRGNAALILIVALHPFLVDDALLRAHEVEVAVYRLPLRCTFGT